MKNPKTPRFITIPHTSFRSYRTARLARVQAERDKLTVSVYCVPLDKIDDAYDYPSRYEKVD